MQKYTFKDFQKEFPDDKACLQWLVNARWPDGIHCDKCNAATPHHMMDKRRAYACQDCGTHVYPCAGTIFHKSPTPLTYWFHTAFLMASTRCGISAKQIERQLGVTYKTAWRMCHLIRQCLDEGVHPLSAKMDGHIEVDESYFGGKAENMHKDKKADKIQGRGVAGKTAVFGIVERTDENGVGRVRAIVVPNTQMTTLTKEIMQIVQKGSTISSDEFKAYGSLTANDYTHGIVKHSEGQYVVYDGDVQWHINTLEGYWSLVKRGISGVFHQVSPKYLQNYLSEYSFRYSHRGDKRPMFRSFLSRMGRALD